MRTVDRVQEAHDRVTKMSDPRTPEDRSEADRFITTRHATREDLNADANSLRALFNAWIDRVPDCTISQEEKACRSGLGESDSELVGRYTRTPLQGGSTRFYYTDKEKKQADPEDWPFQTGGWLNARLRGLPNQLDERAKDATKRLTEFAGAEWYIRYQMPVPPGSHSIVEFRGRVNGKNIEPWKLSERRDGEPGQWSILIGAHS